MASTIAEFVTKGTSIFYEGNLSARSKEKFLCIGARYATLQAFKRATPETFNGFRTEEGKRCFTPLTPKETHAITALQEATNETLSLKENFIVLLTCNFIRKQTEMLRTMDIDSLNPNPILCTALNLNTPEDLITYCAYAAITRSIVTSMGFFVQDLLLFADEQVYDDGKLYAEGNKTK